MTAQNYASLPAVFATIILAALLNFLAKLYRVRITIARLRKLGLVRFWGKVLTTGIPNC